MKIKVKAIGVNRADVFFREGKYPVFGIECAGVAEDGRRVAAIVDGGAYDPEVEAHESGVIDLPASMSFEEGASIIEALYTSYYNLVSLCKLQKGEKVLIHGGGSGVGVVAIQLAKLLGADVYATAGKPEKLALIKKLGATAIDYTSSLREGKAFEAIQAGSLRSARDDGFDVILDIIGANYFDKNLAALNQNGRLAIISFIGGAKGEFNLAPLLTKSLSVFGSTIRGLDNEKRGEIREKIIPYFTQIRPVIDRVFPYAEKEQAIDYVRDYKNVGKVVILRD